MTCSKEGSPEIAAAEGKFARLSEELVNPVKQGPVGQFATPRGYMPDRAASTAKLTSMFDNGVSPSSGNSPIRTLGKELGKADPGSLPGRVQVLVDVEDRQARRE